MVFKKLFTLFIVFLIILNFVVTLVFYGSADEARVKLIRPFTTLFVALLHTSQQEERPERGHRPCDWQENQLTIYMGWSVANPTILSLFLWNISLHNFHFHLSRKLCWESGLKCKSDWWQSDLYSHGHRVMSRVVNLDILQVYAVLSHKRNCNQRPGLSVPKYPNPRFNKQNCIPPWTKFNVIYLLIWKLS